MSGQTRQTLDLGKELLDAVWDGDVKEVDSLVSQGADLNFMGIVMIEFPIAPLSLACMRGNLTITRLLVNAKADLNLSGHNGKTPLHYTCEGDERRELSRSSLLEILKLLIGKGANLEAQDNMGCTPLFSACEMDDVDMVKVLVQAGSNVNIQTVNGDSPMKVACRNAKFWTYWHGKEMGNTSSHINPNNFPPIQITKLLLQADADISEATLLPTVVQFGDSKLVKELIDLGMDINMLDDNMCTPLGSACSSASVKLEVVKLLLDHGADIDRGGGWKKQKPIIFAYVHNSVDKICLLLSYGASITDKEMTGLVSLSMSKSILENPEVVSPWSKELMSWQLLLAAGFHPLTSDSDLSNKLHQLSMCSSYEKINPWIWDLLTPVHSLKDACRICIRKHLTLPIDRNIDVLPIPTFLKHFLHFQEFFECDSKSPSKSPVSPDQHKNIGST
ncbi:hypothetical protein FSP39_019962 [Pinctada imbricata]|uniref:SOCS box domain-containing protein n=1 Tax=Pinctada imbricata TaxID=66713 RepID=A0AA88Y995_PINIB|nr:hypothetical protein FSP39_019962 [Pinctada imbricata]